MTTRTVPRLLATLALLTASPTLAQVGNGPTASPRPSVAAQVIVVDAERMTRAHSSDTSGPTADGRLASIALSCVRSGNRMVC